MNQAIQFPDDEYWDENTQAIVFPALVNGLTIMCAIHKKTIATRYGGTSQDKWLLLFQQHRWDLEDEAERLIIDQKEDEQGCIWLS